MNLLPTNVDFVVKTTCILHSFLLNHKAHPDDYFDREASFRNHAPAEWRRDGPGSASDHTLLAFEPTPAHNYGEYTLSAGKCLMVYFASKAGEVPWQWRLPGVSKEVVLRNLLGRPRAADAIVFSVIAKRLWKSFSYAALVNILRTE